MPSLAQRKNSAPVHHSRDPATSAMISTRRKQANESTGTIPSHKVGKMDIDQETSELCWKEVCRSVESVDSRS